MATIISVILGDITKLKVDAIVNAANNGLLGGGGVDGAIHRACGPDLLQACRSLGGCPTGGAKITPAFGHMSKNGVKYIIHAVGPLWHGGRYNEPEQLKDAYINSLKEAMTAGVKSIAFPAISCGVYSYPIDQAAEIACNAVQNFVKEHPTAFDEVIFTAFSKQIFDEYSKYAN